MVRHRRHVDGLVPDLLLVVDRAHVHADAAARAVVGGHLDGHQRVGEVLAPPLLVSEARGGVVEGSGVVDLHADGGMGADQRALGAVDADLGVPDGDLGRDGALLRTAGPGREGPVHGQGADRKAVALPRQHRRGHPLHEGGGLSRHQREAGPAAGAAGGDGDLREAGERGVDRRQVPGDDDVAALAV